jgi:hypothetical protein
MVIALEQLSGTARSFVLAPGILIEQEKEVSHSDNYRNHGVA